MIEPKFVSKDELTRREGYIQKSRDAMKELRAQRLVLAKEGKSTKEIDDKIDFYIDDIQTATKILLKDTKDFNAYNRWEKQKELQARTLPTATRDAMPYEDYEIELAREYSHEDEDMVELALKLNRTYYGIEMLLRKGRHGKNGQYTSIN